MAQTTEAQNFKMSHQNGRLALVVDDEATSLLILSSMLEAQAMSVKCAKSADEMEVMLRANDFDVIFLDYKLGKIDGLELLGKIVGAFPRIKVVMITAHASIDLAVQAMHGGASGFITVPLKDLKRRDLFNAPRFQQVASITAIFIGY